MVTTPKWVITRRLSKGQVPGSAPSSPPCQQSEASLSAKSVSTSLSAISRGRAFLVHLGRLTVTLSQCTARLPFFCWQAPRPSTPPSRPSSFFIFSVQGAPRRSIPPRGSTPRPRPPPSRPSSLVVCSEGSPPRRSSLPSKTPLPPACRAP